MDKQTYDEIHTAFMSYLDTYFVKRDLSATLRMFKSHISGFGTGVDEKAFRREAFKELYSRDIAQAPNPIQYSILNLNMGSPLKDAGIVSCELNLKTRILDQDIALNNLRLSLFFIKEEGQWLIEHMHISFPTSTHEENESYPIKELEARNRVLQRRVEEKTETLKAANRKLETALKEIKTLRGIIPICSYCKKIRTDDQSWQMIETYIREHSDAEFSHGICPDCLKKYYPEIDL